VRRVARVAALVACFVLGAAFLVVASDVLRWDETLRDDDVRWVVAPEEEGLWQPTEVVPYGIAGEALAVDDDVAYRRALRALRLSRPHVPSLSDPAVVLVRNEATARLTGIVQSGAPAERRSRAANLLGVLSFADSLYDQENRRRLLESATSRFRQSIDLDPENGEAKHNLELTLARSEAVELSESGGGASPLPGGQGAKGAGTGDPGSGY
jgi:hypothetical protein